METHEEWQRGCEERLLLTKQAEATLGIYWLIGWICSLGILVGSLLAVCGVHG